MCKIYRDSSTLLKVLKISMKISITSDYKMISKVLILGPAINTSRVLAATILTNFKKSSGIELQINLALINNTLILIRLKPNRIMRAFLAIYTKNPKTSLKSMPQTLTISDIQIFYLHIAQ